jgi:hypothetical protein
MLTFALLAVPTFGQSPVQKDAPATSAVIQHPTEGGRIPSPDELISYRFRLAAEDANFNLVALNRTNEPGKFLFQGLTSESVSRPTSIQPREIGAGQSITVSAGDLNWLAFQCMYVLASRRIELRLVRSDAPNSIAVPLTRRGTLYDVVSEQRLGEIDSDADFERSISLLGNKSNPNDVVVVKPHENLLTITAQALAKDQPADPPRIFLVSR